MMDQKGKFKKFLAEKGKYWLFPLLLLVAVIGFALFAGGGKMRQFVYFNF